MDLKSFFRKFNSKTYLVVAFTGISIIPVVMLTLIQYSFFSGDIISLIEKNNISLVKNLADKFEQYIKINIQTINHLASTIKEKKEKDIKITLDNFSQNYPDYKAFFYFYNDKLIVYHNHNINNSSYNLLKRYYIKENAKNLNKSFIINNIELDNKSKCIGLVSPIYNNNEYKGFLLACLDKEQIKLYINSSLENEQKVIILDKSNNNIIYPDNNDLSFINKDSLKKIKEEQSGVIESYSIINKKQEAISYTSINSLNWLVMYEYPLTEYRDDVINLSIKIIIASIISLFCALAMGLWIASYQYTFSKNILASIREIANGNYKKKVESNLFFIPYEFDQMVNEFNVMREKIEQLDHFKSNLIDTVSHEFRTPLTSIKGFSSTLLRKDVKFDDETQNRLLKIISTQSDRLSRMVEDLLVVPKLEGHVLKLNLQEVELEPLFEDLSQFFPNKEFSIKIKESIYVLVDSDRFEQIILNLFENANKYSNPKTSSIRVRAFKEDSFAHIIVSNCSNKIEQNKLDSLFDKFFRLDDALTRTTGGTGLGLYITKSLVELMNGKIWLESTNEQFKVHILLPLDDLEI